MIPYKQLRKVTATKFKRTSGQSKDDFQKTLVKVRHFIQQDKDKNPSKKRGKKSTKISQNNRLLGSALNLLFSVNINPKFDLIDV